MNSEKRMNDWITAIVIFSGALLLFGLFPSHNFNYADDSLRWAYEITLTSGLVNSHHFFFNALRHVYHSLHEGLGISVDPARLLAAYSAFWGAIGLAFFYRLLKLLDCGRAALPATIACAFMTNYWAYSIVGDVYIPATALMVAGTYAFLASLRATASTARIAWMAGAVVAFVLMTLHHQAYSIYAGSLAAGILLTREATWSRRMTHAAIVLGLTGLISLAVYGVVFEEIPNPEGASFGHFVSGYAESFDARPDQKLLSLSTLVNSMAGQVRAMIPYYIVFHSKSISQAIQQRFPYRNVYPYPYLVRSLGPFSITLTLLGIAVAGFTGIWFFARGIMTAVFNRDGSLAILIATFPTAVFFMWWEGISDEFWIWSLPLIALLAAKGAVRGSRFAVPAMYAMAAGFFVSSLFGAMLPFFDSGNDIDAVNQRYLSRAGSADLVVGFDEIQSNGRANLTRIKTGFAYFNVFARAAKWSDADLAILDHEVAATLAKGGKIFVSPYVLHPPKSNLANLLLLNPKFSEERQTVITHLQAVDPRRIEWQPEVGIVPGYFVN